MKWQTLLIVGLILTGCATEPVDPWKNIEVSAAQATTPVELPIWPIPVAWDSETVTFDIAGARRLDAYKIVAEGNTTIAKANADQVNELNQVARQLDQAGSAQWELTRIQEQILKEERTRHVYEKGFLYAGIIALILAL